MKKYFQSITDVSLFQQLTIIIFTFGFFLVVFFSIYLRGNINDFVDNQIMSILRASQSTIVAREEGNSSGTSELSADAQVMHFVLNRGTFVRFYGEQYEPELLNDVVELAKTLEESWSEGVKTLAGNSYFYRIYRINNNRVVISLIRESYGNNIENTLLSGVSNTTAVAVSIMFILIMIWTASIITPLQQIRFYIDRVRKGEEATLNIDRKDEIGELAQELVSLRDELKHQEETMEEMVHNISHDLKTPIATIKSYAESIKDGIYPYDTLEKSVDVIIDNADRLEQKVYSLLFLNRLD
ncbi:MAG: HAMP domain-containing histidine kinase [Erysipelotrichaceae bacterium]|nr:HAMP domain-containing histidine kinase [Erysipelotrichaceae bacterium]